MTIFDIDFSENDYYLWSERPPDSYNGIIIPGGVFHTVEAGVGYMAMQHLHRPQFDIWLSSYLMKSKRKTHVRADYSALEFSLIIENSVIYNFNSFGKIDQQETQFNISYMTDIDSKVVFEAGKRYTTLDIHCSFSFMERLAVAYPEIVNPLLDAMVVGRQHQVFPRYIYASRIMMEIVVKILKDFATGIDEFVLDLMVQLLIANALCCRMAMLRPASMRNFDIMDRMNMISTFLMKDLTMFPHIKMLAKMVPMNETTFKKVFKDAFLLSPHQFWSKGRLEAAFDRVVHSKMPIKEIALEMGFGTIQSFSKEFKKQYKKPPSVIRRNS